MVRALMLYGIGLGSKPVAHAGFLIFILFLFYFIFLKELDLGLLLGLGSKQKGKTIR